MRHLLATAFGALVIGCSGMPSILGSESLPSGEIHLSTAGLGSAVLHPTTCRSGEWELFLGADFPDAGGLTTRLMVDPHGIATIRFFRTDQPLDPGISFGRAACDSFDMSLERTGWQVNDIYDLRVSLEFDCRSASGDTATGHLAVDHCH